jgi:hypothetical protein
MNYKVLLLLFLFSCTNEQQEIPTCASAQDLQCFEIEKGDHAAKPRLLSGAQAIEVTEQSWSVTFGEGTDYDLRNADQLDWNKLCGRTFDLFIRDAYATMIGWRYNTTAEKIELIGYFNEDSDFFLTGPIVEVEQCELVELTMTIDFDAGIYAWTVSKEDGTWQQFLFSFNHSFRSSYEVNTWFGGNRTAPNDMRIYKSET